MSTKNKKRIYISVSPDVEKALTLLSAQKNIPIATTASHLLELALEIEEDEIWDEIASSRKNSKDKLYSHKKAWA
jgi:DNA-binding transcriptional regulator GbsR (MarR family)